MGLKVVGDEAVATLDATSVDSCNTGLIPVAKSALKRVRKQRKYGISLSGQGRGSSTMSLSLEAWVEGLKGKVGHDEVQIQLIEEARQDAASLLLGKLQGKKEDELISNASSMKINKGDEVEFSEKGSENRKKGEKQCEDAADERDSGINEEFAIDEIESSADVGSADYGSASYEEEHLVGDSFSVYEEEAADVGGGEGDSAAGNDEEWADDEEGRDESGEYDDGDDNRMGMGEGSNVDEYDEYEFNSEEWLDWLERGLRYARGGKLMHEVLKEIHSYMRVVYDVQQQIFWEDESSFALKGCVILREIVRASPVRGLLHPESELGYQLLMNEEVIGRSLCRWAWRKFRRDWEENLMRLDVKLLLQLMVLLQYE
nr:hypothetical protein Iba_chr09aCG2110 [Ipomoea batatas]